MNLPEMLRAARDLQSAMNESGENAPAPCTEDTGAGACIAKEEDRPLTRQEKAKGWARRPWSAYDPARLCDACAAYWFAGMVCVSLESIQRRQAIVEAEKARRK